MLTSVDLSQTKLKVKIIFLYHLEIKGSMFLFIFISKCTYFKYERKDVLFGKQKFIIQRFKIMKSDASRLNF